MNTKSILVITFFCLFIAATAFASSGCFIVADLLSHTIIKQEGDACSLRVSPCSTFKIALSLMGYDAQVLRDTKTPVWFYQNSYATPFAACRSSHNPTTWISDCCV